MLLVSIFPTGTPHGSILLPVREYRQTAFCDTSRAATVTGINGIVAAAGYNYSLLLRWLTALLRAVIAALFQTTAILHDGSLEASRPIMRG